MKRNNTPAYSVTIHKLHCTAMKYRQERAKANAALRICQEYREALHDEKQAKQELELTIHDLNSDYGLLADELKTEKSKSKLAFSQLNELADKYKKLKDIKDAYDKLAGDYQTKCCELARLRIKYRDLRVTHRALDTEYGVLSHKYARVVGKAFAKTQANKAGIQ